MRSKELFNEDWLFCRFEIDDNGVAENEPAGLEQIDCGFSEWQNVNLPHDWAIAGPFIPESDGSMGKLPSPGVGWYRKNFTLDQGDLGKRIFIDIDGAMSNSTVWVNGQEVGGWPYGYNSFRIDITDAVNCGSNNLIAVQLKNLPDSSRWYPGGGIYRNVYLVRTEPVHVAHWGTFVRCDKISAESANIDLTIEVENQSEETIEVVVENQIYNDDILVLALPDQTVLLGPGSEQKLNDSVLIETPKLWSPDSPELYCLKTQLRVAGQVVDQYDTTFGIRSIEYDVKRGFVLNGQVTTFKGVCDHHDLGPLGAAINRRAIQRKIEILKEMGCNAIRTAHNMPAPEFLQLCDEMGMLVQAEAFDCWEIKKRNNDYHQYFKEWHEKDIINFVRRDRNHPCIVMWSSGNEILEQKTEHGIEVGKRLTDIFNREDPTRPVTAGCSFPQAGFNGFQKCVDIFGYNYKPHLYAEFMEKNPDLPLYGSETSGGFSSRSVYFFPVIEDKSKSRCYKSFQVSSYDYSAPSWAEKPDVEFAAQDKYPTVMGEFVWSGFDYLGEPTPYNADLTNLLNAVNEEQKAEIQEALDLLAGKPVPSRSSYFGIVDLCGFKKDRFYLYQAKWRPDYAMVHILPHWNWPERVGKVTPVYVYTAGDEVELFLNGASQGRRRRGEYEYRFCWNDVVYEPGELRAVAYKNGSPWAENVVQTTGDAQSIKLDADRQTIAADGCDLSYITVSVKDAEGRLVPTANELVNFEINGPGEIVAVANGDASSLNPFSAKSCYTFNGLCQVIVRSVKGQNGKIQLTATAQDLSCETIEITGVKPTGIGGSGCIRGGQSFNPPV